MCVSLSLFVAQPCTNIIMIIIMDAVNVQADGQVVRDVDRSSLTKGGALV